MEETEDSTCRWRNNHMCECLDLSPKAEETTDNKLDLIKLKSFCIAKEAIDKKTVYRMGETSSK